MQHEMSHFQHAAENAATIAFFIIAGATTLVILILGVLNFTRDRTRRATIVVQALAALAIWTVLTFVIFFIDLGYLVMVEYAAMQGNLSPAITVSRITRRASRCAPLLSRKQRCFDHGASTMMLMSGRSQTRSSSHAGG